MAAQKAQIPMWLDCDTGHDDAFAILLAAHHEDINLLGLSTVSGNASLPNTTRNTLAVLQALGRPDLLLIKGEAQPLSRQPCHAPEIHGQSGLDGVPLLPTPDTSRLANLPTGASHIASAILSHPPNTVVIVATGPLTNIAKALTSNPALATHIRALSIMGGAIGSSFSSAPQHRTDGPGNHTPWAEFNIFCDPESADLIFSNAELAAKTTLIPLDVTHQCRGTAGVLALLFGGEGKTSRVRRMMRQVMTFFSETYAVRSGIVDGPPMHDPLAVWAVVRPEMFGDGDGERWVVKTVLEGERDGQTVLTRADGGRGVRVPRTVDVEAFWREIDGALGRAERHVGAKDGSG